MDALVNCQWGGVPLWTSVDLCRLSAQFKKYNNKGRCRPSANRAGLSARLSLKCGTYSQFVGRGTHYKTLVRDTWGLIYKRCVRSKDGVGLRNVCDL